MKRLRIKTISGFTKPKHYLIIFSVLTVLIGGFVVLTQLFAVHVLNWESSVIRLNETLPFKNYININVTNIPLTVDIYDGDEIKINYISETELIITDNEYSYTINQDADFTFSLFSKDFLDYRLEILLPDRVYREININSTSGDVYFLRPYSKLINIDTRIGNITVGEALGNVHLSSRFGNIDVTFIDLVNDIDNNSVIETETGKISVLMPDDVKLKLEYYTESGKFYSDFFETIYRGRKGYIFISNSPYYNTLQVITTSGDLSLTKWG